MTASSRCRRSAEKPFATTAGGGSAAGAMAGKTAPPSHPTRPAERMEEKFNARRRRDVFIGKSEVTATAPRAKRKPPPRPRAAASKLADRKIPDSLTPLFPKQKNRMDDL